MISIEEYVGYMDVNEVILIDDERLYKIMHQSQANAYRSVGTKDEPYNSVRNVHMTRMLMGIWNNDTVPIKTRANGSGQ